MEDIEPSKVAAAAIPIMTTSTIYTILVIKERVPFLPLLKKFLQIYYFAVH